MSDPERLSDLAPKRTIENGTRWIPGSASSDPVTFRSKSTVWPWLKVSKKKVGDTVIPKSVPLVKASTWDCGQAPTSLFVMAMVYGTVVSKGTGPLVDGVTVNVGGRPMHASAVSALGLIASV